MRYPAYHCVQGGEDAMKDVLRGEYLVPGKARLHGQGIWDLCVDWADKMQGEWGIRDTTADAIRLLGRDYAEAQGLTKRSFERSRFECPDVIAGDLECVFFSLGEFKYCGENQNGFVFDALRLIRDMDARLRREDFLALYGEIVREVDRYELNTATETASAIEEALRQAGRRGGEKRGTAAMQQLRKSGLDEFSSVELAVRGKVPLSLAEEVWINGERFTP